MKRVLEISLASPTNNFDKIITFQGEKIRVSRICVNYDLKLMEELVELYDGKVNVISCTGLPRVLEKGRHDVLHPATQKVYDLVKKSMLVDGMTFREIYLPWVIRKYAQENPMIFNNKKVCFYTGILQRSLVSFFEELNNSVVCADPYFLFNIPTTLKNGRELDLFLKFANPFLKRIKISRRMKRNFSESILKKKAGLKDINGCDIYVAFNAQFGLMELNDLTGKTFIVEFLTPEIERRLTNAGVKNIIACTPNKVGLEGMNFALIEGIFQAHKDDFTPINQDDIFSWIDKFDLRPQNKVLSTSDQEDHKFAFIIHPLKSTDVLRHPLLRPVAPIFSKFEPVLERALNLAPGVNYGKISGIKSEATGKVVEGQIYTLFSTPKMLLSDRPNIVYNKLVKCAEDASKKGIRIIGLGAYTKIVGDAGVTVAKRSPIPLTTGNSLSSAATLWAAALAVDKMGFVKQKGEIYQGKAMVIGATGSIGKVTAKLLAQNWKDVVIVAPKGHKLLELMDEIKAIAPNVNLKVATSPDNHLDDCDLIITTTSAQGKQIIDIKNVPAGCVICDVSRPFDISEEQAVSRPDVLVIASGEVELPGKVKLNCDIGLPGNTVYACLAETAVLCLEGKFENFTLSRNLNYDKVREIDRLARKHGVKLSAIMGHSTEITDEEIELCRKHALAKKKLYEIENESDDEVEVPLELIQSMRRSGNDPKILQ